jgi:hypothetical protein
MEVIEGEWVMEMIMMMLMMMEADQLNEYHIII